MDPAGGSTASTAVTVSAATTSTRARGRAPRLTATRPAATPAAPAAAAAHSATVTSHATGCRAAHHGGPPAGLGTLTTALLGPAAETTIMISSENPMQATARRLQRLAPVRARPLTAGGSPAAGDTPGTAVVVACSLMVHAPARPLPAATRAAEEEHDSVTDGGSSSPQDSGQPGLPRGSPAGELAHDRQRPAAGTEFRRAPSAGQNVWQK